MYSWKFDVGDYIDRIKKTSLLLFMAVLHQKLKRKLNLICLKLNRFQVKSIINPE